MVYLLRRTSLFLLSVRPSTFLRLGVRGRVAEGGGGNLKDTRVRSYAGAYRPHHSRRRWCRQSDKANDAGALPVTAFYHFPWFSLSC